MNLPLQMPSDNRSFAPVLVTIIEVDRADRIQCQADGCGHSVFKRIHVVLARGEFKILGSQCYQQLFGTATLSAAEPQYGPLSGRRLTASERSMLIENTARFIEALENERLDLERIAEQEAAQLQLLGAGRRQVLPSPAPFRTERAARPALPDLDEARSQLYDGAEMLKWHWRDAASLTACLADYQNAPAVAPHLSVVMSSFQKSPKPTPYLFALDVELVHRLPKRYIFSALDELGLVDHHP